jgi:uncharacterized protein (TIRG00374 family)
LDNSSGGRRRLAALVIAITIMGVLVILMDRREVESALRHASLWPVPFALLFTAASYAAISYDFALVCALFGIRLPKGDLVVVGFVSSVIANLVSLAGVASYSLRLMVLSRRGLSNAEILGPSIFHSYINNLFLVAMLPIGLTILVLRRAPRTAVEAELAAAAAILILLFAVATFALFSAGFRRGLLMRAEGIWKRVSARGWGRNVWELDANLALGVSAAGRRPAVLAMPIALVALDWAACVVTMWFCFKAIGTYVPPGVLLTGFTVGVAAGLLSMIPGGLGVQEGSMAGVYALLGVQFEQALLASIIFRVVYYFVPYLASLVLYRRLLRGG